MTEKHAFLSSALLLVLFIASRTASQILLKEVALGPGGHNFIALLLSPLFYVACCIFVAQAAIWFAILRRMPLSRAYPFSSLTVITLLVSAAVFFGESVTLGNVLGALVIVGGVVVLAGDGEE